MNIFTVDESQLFTSADITTDFDPWNYLEGYKDVHVCIDPIANIGGGAFFIQCGVTQIIALAPGLSSTQERMYLTHELVHMRRGCFPSDCFMNWSLRSLWGKEEKYVRKEVATLLITPDICEQLIHWYIPYRGVLFEKDLQGILHPFVESSGFPIEIFYDLLL